MNDGRHIGIFHSLAIYIDDMTSIFLPIHFYFYFFQHKNNLLTDKKMQGNLFEIPIPPKLGGIKLPATCLCPIRGQISDFPRNLSSQEIRSDY